MAGGIAVNDTVPVKPYFGVIATAAVHAFPATHWTVVGVEGEMSKSGTGTVTVIVTFWFRDPLVPVTLTRYVPGSMPLDAAMLNWDVPEPPGIMVGVNVPVRPVLRAEESCTVPVNPF